MELGMEEFDSYFLKNLSDLFKVDKSALQAYEGHKIFVEDVKNGI